MAEFCKLRSGNAEVSLTQDPDERERSGDNARHDQREEFGFRGGRRGAPNPAAYPQLIAREGREIDPSYGIRLKGVRTSCGLMGPPVVVG